VSSGWGRVQQEQPACFLQDATHSGLNGSKVQKMPPLQRHPSKINSSHFFQSEEFE